MFHSQDIFTGQEFAVKLELCNSSKSYLEHEYGVLNTLQGGTMPGFPQPVWLGREGVYHVVETHVSLALYPHIPHRPIIIPLPSSLRRPS